MQRFSYILVLLFSVSSIFAQNNNCFSALHIQNTDNYCSPLKKFDNINSGNSSQIKPSCWPDSGNDVWYTFKPTELAFVLKLFAEGQYGDLQNPSMVIYTGYCDNLTEIACSSVLSGLNEIEISETNIIIGQLYYIRIDARNGQSGSFTLCVDSFTPVPNPQADCKDAVVLCNKDPFVVERILGAGDDTNEIDSKSCIREEFASVWYKWTCDKSGTLDFDLIPNNPADDLDFVVYRLPNGIDNCSGKISERCMASGEQVGAGIPANTPCTGATGLRASSNDTQENPGCASGDDNYIKSLDMVSGQSYVLIVNNFSKSGFGFAINFGGTGTFLGPNADFEAVALDLFECDKTIRFVNKSNSLTDNIVGYTWQFGAGATPQSTTDIGPHDVIYDSFGDKIVALTIESERGCLVTKLLPIFVNSCCADTSNLDVTVDVTDLLCYNIEDGIIQGMGIAGSPQYQFSIDGVNFQESPFFYNLPSGDFDVTIQDKKGCTNRIATHIDAPPPLIVNAGPDSTINLGDIIQLGASYSPSNTIVDITWSPIGGFINCTDCLDPEIQPPGTTTYIIQIQDENGCLALDTVTIFTEIIRPVVAPNIISLDSYDGNSVFTISVGPAADLIESLEIFDRWGNRVYSAQDIYIDSPYGWDGTFRGKQVQPAVFAWVASVHFIDGVSLNYTGDLTVVR